MVRVLCRVTKMTGVSVVTNFDTVAGDLEPSDLVSNAARTLIVL